MSEYVITIARGFGSGGRTVGKMLAKKLDINHYDGELIQLASEESGINIELFGKADETVKTNLFKRYNRSFGEKLILFKNEYPADNTYNQQIIQYLKDNDDISSAEMKQILVGLGFTVTDNGKIYWD